MSTDAAPPSDESTPADSSRKPRWVRGVLFFLRPKVGIPLVLVGLLVVTPFLYRGYQLSQVPDIGDPFDVAAFSKLHVPNQRNAFVEYGKAGKLYVEIKPRNPDEYHKVDYSDIIKGG